MPPSPLAIFDIGSNAVRLTIYQSAEDGGLPTIIKKDVELCEMGRTHDVPNTLYPPGVKKALKTIDRFCQTIRNPNLGVAGVVAVATEALRSATDGPDFIQTLKTQFDLDVRILSPEEEGIYGAQGVSLGLPKARGIVADLGGGSMQMTYLWDGVTTATHSLPIGTLRAIAHQDNLLSWVQLHFRSLPPDLSHTPHLYIIGGSWRALAKLYLMRAGRDTHDIQGVHLDVDKLSSLNDWLQNLPPTTRHTNLAQDYHIDHNRINSLLVAAPMLVALIDYIGAPTITVSSAGIRDGLFMAAIKGDIPLGSVPQKIKSEP